MTANSIPLHGGQLRDIAERFQIPEESLLDFSANICPIPLGEAMIEALCESLRNRKIIAQYPDTEYRDLKDAIAAYGEINHDSICIANGVMPLLDVAIRALGLRRCLVLVPAFGEYQRVLKACGVENLNLLLPEQNNFRLDPNLLLKEAISCQADAVLLANPHSPSGALTQVPVLTGLQRILYSFGITTIVDEAFIDFCPESSMSGFAAHETGIVVLRSLTKFFAIPGMRVAYAVTHPELRAKMESMLPLWSVDSLAALAARLGMLDGACVREKREANVREREWLSEQLVLLGWRVFPSGANYLLIRPPVEVDGLEVWTRLIVEHRIVLRNCATFEGLSKTHFRVSVRDRVASVALVTSLAQIF